MNAARALFARECAAAWAGGGGAASSATFFLAAAALTAFAVGPSADLLAAAAPGALMIAFTFAAMLGLEHLFQNDLDSGALDELALGPLPLTAVAAVKILARAAAALWPAALVAPIAAVLLGLDGAAALVSGVACLAAAPALVAAGAAPAALAAGRPRGALLIAVVSPPFRAPTVIFAAGAIRAAAIGTDPTAPLFLLAASALASLVVGAAGAAAALRLHLE